MVKRKPLVSFDRGKCSSCISLVCIGVCPQGILETDAEDKPMDTDASECTSCGVCVSRCPQKAITINSRNASKKDNR